MKGNIHMYMNKYGSVWWYMYMYMIYDIWYDM